MLTGCLPSFPSPPSSFLLFFLHFFALISTFSRHFFEHLCVDRLLALISNIIEIYIDSYKLCHTMQVYIYVMYVCVYIYSLSLSLSLSLFYIHTHTHTSIYSHYARLTYLNTPAHTCTHTHTILYATTSY